MNGTTEEWRDCETCGSKMPVHDLVRTWCDGCGWNLSDARSYRDVIDEKIDALGKVHGAWLLDQVITASERDLRPRLTVPRLAALVISVLILIANIIVGLAGLALIVWGWPHVMFIIGGLVLLAVAWFLRPQFGAVPDDCLERSEFPNLFSMVDGIAGQLSMTPIEHIRVDHNFNASMAEVGLARTPVLTIGLPLWAILNGQERIALMAHELAHRANRDPARSTVIGWGLSALDRWLYLMDPMDQRVRNLADVMMHLLLRLIGGAIAGLRKLLASLLFLDSQRAEYLADHLAARIAGPVAKVKLLGKLGLDHNLKAVAERAYYAGDTDGRSVIDAFRAFVETVPEREMERVRRADEQESSRIDSAHPPTASRIRFIKSRHYELPLAILSDSLSRAIDEELQPFHERLSMRLMDDVVERPDG
ncbi:M48 family metalloprotease [Taklimakanibacter deserti]|uniref:M48 family metalloprotease n=1 Tax=Taklimakanibacter deserti TaxID=2267839 RepID=UPI0013C4F1EF